MKKSYIAAFLILILTIPAVLFAADLSLPKIYGETYYAELAEMTDKLYETRENKIVLIGGSNIAFGTDTELLEKLLAEKGYDYTVCSYGLYAAVGTSAMLSLSADALKDGDIVVLALEPTADTLTDYFGAGAFLKCAESDPALFWKVNADQRSALIGNYIPVLQERISVVRSGILPKAEGVYSKASFDEACNMIYDRTGNNMALGFDPTEPVAFSSLQIEDSFAGQINEYCTAASKKGAQVYLSFSPVNSTAVEDGSEEALQAYYDMLDDAIYCPIISDPGRYILDSAWFYDSNFHLNSAGAILRTKLLAEDLLAAFGCTEAVPCDIPAPPESIYVAVENTVAAVSDFVCEETEGGALIVTGLTDDGLAKTSLELPGAIDDQPVIGFTADAFSASTILEELTLPESILSIPDAAFAGCTSLKRLILLHESTPCSITEHSFDGADDLRVYVPEEAYPLYRDGFGCEANPWNACLDRVYTY